MAIDLEQDDVKGRLQEIMVHKGFEDYQIDSYFKFYNEGCYSKRRQTREAIDRMMSIIRIKLEENPEYEEMLKNFGIDFYSSAIKAREVSFLSECGKVFHRLYDKISESIADKENFVNYLTCLQTIVGRRNLLELLLIIL